MAGIEQRGGKTTPRVDLTPMVDLNLLLITFFMFTTSLSKPKAMSVNMPFEKHTGAEVKKDAAMTILLGGMHQLYYYADPQDIQLQQTTFKNNQGIRAVLLKAKKKVAALQASGTLSASDELTILIKPDTSCTTDDVVDLIDEMTVNGIKIYAITDITPEEQGLIANYDNAKPVR